MYITEIGEELCLIQLKCEEQSRTSKILVQKLNLLLKKLDEAQIEERLEINEIKEELLPIKVKYEEQRKTSKILVRNLNRLFKELGENPIHKILVIKDILLPIKAKYEEQSRTSKILDKKLSLLFNKLDEVQNDERLEINEIKEELLPIKIKCEEQSWKSEILVQKLSLLFRELVEGRIDEFLEIKEELLTIIITCQEQSWTSINLVQNIRLLLNIFDEAQIDERLEINEIKEELLPIIVKYEEQSRTSEILIQKLSLLFKKLDEIQIDEFRGIHQRMIPNDQRYGEILTLSEIDRYCSNYYADTAKIIIVIVLARFDLDEVKSIIRKHYNYWHELTGENVDFFWLGYDVNHTPGEYRGENERDFINGLKFDNRSFIVDVYRLEKLTDYNFGDEIGLLLVETFNGHVRFDRSLYLNIEALAHQEVDTKLKKFFRFLINSCKSHSRIKDINGDLKRIRRFYSLKDITLIDMLNLVEPATGLFGAFKLL